MLRKGQWKETRVWSKKRKDARVINCAHGQDFLNDFGLRRGSTVGTFFKKYVASSWSKVFNELVNFKKIFSILTIASIGDALTTYFGLSLGFTETRLLGETPLLNLLVLGPPLVMIKKIGLPRKYEIIRSTIIAALVAFSFSGLLWNIYGLIALT
jgi:hypothetical protein